MKLDQSQSYRLVQEFFPCTHLDTSDGVLLSFTSGYSRGYFINSTIHWIINGEIKKIPIKDINHLQSTLIDIVFYGIYLDVYKSEQQATKLFNRASIICGISFILTIASLFVF